MDTDHVSGRVVDTAMRAHWRLGPGVLESAYEACLAHEPQRRERRALRWLALPAQYDGSRIDAGRRIDILVEELVIVELKAVQAVTPVHRAQLLSYPRLGHKRIGLLFNFNVRRLRDGIERFVDDF